MTQKRGPGRPTDLAKVDAILCAGWELFLERGVAAVSIEAIASRASVSKMTVYKHFADKHALFEQAVIREMRSIEATQKTRPPSEPDVDLESQLRAFGMGIMSFLATGAAIDFYNVLAGELRRHPVLARTFHRAGPAQTIRNLAAILAGCGDRLLIDDPVEAAEVLFGMWQGASNFDLALGLNQRRRKKDVAKRVDRGIALFMRAFSRPSR